MATDISVSKDITFKRINEDLNNSFYLDFDINTSKFVFFSDLHKGTKKRSDAFRQNEIVCCCAFDHYFREGYTLVQAGDAEEGWGFKIGRALKKYNDTVLKFEKKFFRETERYVRIFGNHDIKWRKPKKVRKILEPHLSSGSGKILRVKSGLRLGKDIVVIHGQQGSFESDLIWKVSKGIVRFVTTVFFRIFGRKKKRAANNPLIRHERDILLNSWATEHHKLLIAGHTHRFIFGSKHSLRTVYSSLIELSKRDRDKMNDIEKLIYDQSIEGLQSDFEGYVNQVKKDISEYKLNENCYFNIGAGVYADGVTCIEIDCGKIRMIFWPNNRLKSGLLFDISSGIKIFETPGRTVLFEDDLKKIVKKL